jgi:predicted PurR-regulated permease PerM
LADAPPSTRVARLGPSLSPVSWNQSLLVLVGVIAALYVARDIFVPIALAILLAFVLAPLVRLLRRVGINRVGAVLISVLLAFVVILGIGGVLARQVSELAENLPGYQANIRDKVQSIRGAAMGSSAVERVTEAIENLQQEIRREPATGDAAPAAPGAAAPPAAATQPEPRPIPVEVRQPEPGPLEVVRQIVEPLLEPLTTTGIVLVFVIFILLYREDLRDRFIRLMGTSDLHRTTAAMDDAAYRLSRFFLVQLGLNAAFGVLIGVGLWFIGVPNPILWGIIAMLMRFVPYVGSFVAAGFPALLAVAVDPGWAMLGWTLALFVILEPLMGQVVEPMVYGHSTGVSPIAVIVAATFWLWLWGPIGLILAVPLTVCVVVLGRHVERLEFLDIILGDQPALAPDKSFYQRMLAGDPYEVAEQAHRYLKEHALSAYYDEVALQGLALAQADVAEGRLDAGRLATIRDSVAAVVEDLADIEDVEPEEAPAELDPEEPQEPSVPPSIAPEALPPGWEGEAVLVLPAHTPLDEAAALMLAQMLEKHGLGARAAGLDDVTGPGLARIEAGGLKLVCVSYFGAATGLARARYLVRRLKRRFPGARIVACLWSMGEDRNVAEGTLAAGADLVVGTLKEAVEAAVRTAMEAAVPAAAEVAAPAA